MLVSESVVFSKNYLSNLLTRRPCLLNSCIAKDLKTFRFSSKTFLGKNRITVTPELLNCQFNKLYKVLVLFIYDVKGFFSCLRFCYWSTQFLTAKAKIYECYIKSMTFIWRLLIFSYFDLLIFDFWFYALLNGPSF